MKKLFFFDVETTGLDPAVHDIVQLAYIIDRDGEIVDTGDLYLRPSPGGSIDPDALRVQGRTLEQVMAFPPASDAYHTLIGRLSLHIDKFNRADKLYPVAYCGIQFDYPFLQNFFKRQDDPFFGSWYNHRVIDPIVLARTLDFKDILVSPDLKLHTVCESFGVPLSQAHDALADVTAMRELFYKMVDLFDERKAMALMGG